MSPIFLLSEPSTLVPLNFEARSWSGFCAAMKSADFMPEPVLGVVALGLSWLVALGLSWLIDGELLDGGLGDWASAVPIANALTAEISASFLSIVGLLCESIEEAKPSVPGAPLLPVRQLASGRPVPAEASTNCLWVRRNSGRTGRFRPDFNLGSAPQFCCRCSGGGAKAVPGPPFCLRRATIS